MHYQVDASSCPGLTHAPGQAPPRPPANSLGGVSAPRRTVQRNEGNGPLVA